MCFSTKKVCDYNWNFANWITSCFSLQACVNLPLQVVEGHLICVILLLPTHLWSLCIGLTPLYQNVLFRFVAQKRVILANETLKREGFFREKCSFYFHKNFSPFFDFDEWLNTSSRKWKIKRNLISPLLTFRLSLQIVLESLQKKVSPMGKRIESGRKCEKLHFFLAKHSFLCLFCK